MREVLAGRPERGPMGGRSTDPEPGFGFAHAARGVMRAALRHPVEIATGLVLTGAGAAIALNALTFQAGPHPAPWFGGASEVASVNPAPLPPTRPAAAPVAPAVPMAPVAPVAPPPPIAVKAPGAREGADPARGTDGPASSGVSRTGSIPAPPAKPVQARDSIGDLIRSGETGAGRPNAASGESQRVVAGQRALAKLGYGPLKADGLMGSGTHQAIERFERDRRLPVTGELNGRTARELAAHAGISIE